MRLTLRKKIVIAIIILASIAVGIIVGIIFPTIHYINGLDRETYDLRVYLEKKYERSLNARTALKQADSVKATLAQIPDRLFRKEDELALITELEALAAKNAVSQKIISSNIDAITNNHITISLGIVGGYHDILNYLADIENERYFITLTHVSLTPTMGQNPTAETSVTMNLDLSIYVSS